jgi:hypothetical protein
MNENQYQAKVIRKLKGMFPGCIILKNDTDYIQGMLDLTILWKEFWGMLETKSSKHSPVQPNQEYYVKLLDKMHFAAFIYPENEEEVLSALQSAFRSPRRARVS